MISEFHQVLQFHSFDTIKLGGFRLGSGSGILQISADLDPDLGVSRTSDPYLGKSWPRIWIQADEETSEKFTIFFQLFSALTLREKILIPMKMCPRFQTYVFSPKNGV